MKPREILDNQFQKVLDFSGWNSDPDIENACNCSDKVISDLRKWIEGKRKQPMVDTPMWTEKYAVYNQALDDLLEELK